MRTSQLLPFALLGSAIAIPVQVQERDNGIIDKRTYVTKSEVVWTTTTLWSTEFVYETGTPDVGAAGFEGNEEPKHTSTKHKQHQTHAKPTPVPFTPPASTPAAPVPTSTSSSAAPPPPPPSSSAPAVAPAPAPTSTSVPPPPPPAPSSTSVSVAPVESSAPAPVPSVSAPAPAPAAPAPAPVQSSSSSKSSSSSSGSSGATGQGTQSAPFVGEGTFYDTGMGSCGTTSTDSEPIVAVGIGYMSKFNGANPNNNEKCGMSITIEYNGVQKSAKIVDTCAGCKTPYDLDMSPTLFQEFADESIGRITNVNWWFD